MKTLMRNGRDRQSENPSLGHAKQERVSLFGTDQRITSGPVARRPHSKAEYMTAPERFADSQIPLAPRAPRAPSIHDPKRSKHGLFPQRSILPRCAILSEAMAAPRRAGSVATAWGGSGQVVGILGGFVSRPAASPPTPQYWPGYPHTRGSHPCSMYQARA
jgi:hypothetical protein